MNIEKKRVFLIEIMPTQDQIITSLNRWKISLLQSISKGLRMSSRWANHFFSKQLPAWLDTVRQMDRRDWKRFFTGIIHRKEHRKKVLFPLVVLMLFTGLLLIIQNNRKTFIPEAEFRRTILGSWDYASDTNQAGITTRLKKEKNGVSVEVERENSQIQFKLPLANPSLKVSKNKATYLNQLENVEVQYEIEATKLKESIILHSPSSSSEFTSTLLVQNLVAKVNSENLPVFFDSENNYQFHLEKPFAEDAAGNKTFDLKYVLKPKTTTIEANPFQQKGEYKDNLLKLETLRDVPVNTNEYDLIVIVDPEWLMDPARQYPILIDPTITHDTSAEFTVGTFNRVRDTGSGSAPVLETYYQETPTNQGVAGLWRMNNTWNDASSNAINGTAQGNATFTTSALLGSHAGSFDGTDDSILIGDNATTSITGRDLTLMAWVYLNSGETTASIIHKGLHYSMHIAANQLTYADSINYSYANNGSYGYVPTQRWVHLAITFDGQTRNHYINGQLVGVKTGYAGSLTDNAVPLLLGCYDDTGVGGAACSDASSLNGLLDDVVVAKKVYSPEEIMAIATRRPYSMYTSPVIDLGTNVSDWSAFQKLAWTENGVKTGNAETPLSSTGLVAQWNFNETGGITANNDAERTSCGGTPASCDGTLFNFDNTSGQDLDPDSSWTSDNAQWGSGALLFDGTDTYITVPDNNSLSFGNGGTDTPFSISTWVKPDSLNGTGSGNWIVNKRDAGAGDEYQLVFWQKQIMFSLFTSNANVISQATTKAWEPGNWYNIVTTYDGSKTTAGMKIYVNGKLEPTTVSTAGTYTGMPNGTQAVVIGKPGWSSSLYFDGVIDTTAIYSRELTASEVLSNYQASNIQFQTRGGADSTPDDGTWETWKPYSNEVTLKTFDETHLLNTTDTGLIDYWPMDETVNNSCSGGVNDVCDKKGSNDMAVTGSLTRIVDGNFSKARYFPGGVTSDYISKSSYSNFPTTAITTEFWVKTTDSTDGLISYASSASDNEWLIYDSSNLKIYRGTAGFVTSGIAVNDGLWHHIAVTWNSSNGNVQLYKDGVEVYVGSLATGTSIVGSGTLILGQEQDSLGGTLDAAQALTGNLDEIRISNTILTPETIRQHFLEGSSKPESLNSFISTVIKKEGTGSQKIIQGRLPVDGNTIALWHLDETQGDGVGKDLFDSSIHANDLELLGSTVTQGLMDKAQNFSGTAQYAFATNATSLQVTGALTLEAWVNTSAAAANRGIIAKMGTGGGFLGYVLRENSSGVAEFGVSSNGTLYTPVLGTSQIRDGKWHHIVGTYTPSTNIRIYVDGVLEATNSTSIPASIFNTISDVTVGATYTSGSELFSGKIDEARISNVARSADEIAESFRMGRDHFINYTLTAPEDLSDETVIPFSIAADRPGTYLSVLVGESPFANYQTDKNTVGLWHLEEKSGAGAYFKDVSGYANNGTPTGTGFAQGKIGKGRYFNGTSDTVTIPNSTSLNINGAGSAETIDFWFNASALTAGFQSLVYKNTGGADCSATGCSDRQFAFWIHSTGYALFNATSNSNIGVTTSGVSTSVGTIQTNQWYHVAGVVDSSNGIMRIYLNGQEMGSSVFSNTGIRSATGNLFLGAATGTANFFNGFIDEVRISNTARSAEEIRQIYDIGKRSHSVTIDFGAFLDSGNLISNSGDTSFTVDATQYGLTSKGSSLHTGDTIIIQENHSGTEYIAQGSVDSVNLSTGAVTVASWDSGSTFPSGGFTVNANVFKWQRELFDISGGRTNNRNTASLLSLRVSDGGEGRTIWVDDVRAAGNYLTTPLGSSITTTTGKRYVQYRTLFTSSDAFVSASLSSVTTDAFGAGDITGSGRCYLEEDPQDRFLTLHWTDSATNEIAYEIQRRINGGDWQPVDMTSPNAITYSDPDIAQGNTYQYQVRKVTDDGGTGTWCTTSVVDLGVGSFQMEGLQLEGIQIN